LNDRVKQNRTDDFQYGQSADSSASCERNATGGPRFYPVFLSLEGRTCLVVGGGAVGERKVRELLKYGVSIRMVSRDLTPWLAERLAEGRLVLAGSEYSRAHLDGADLVFAATSDMEVNRTIAGDARSRGLWCNMAIDPELGSFIVPSVVRKGPLCIAISTGGSSPAAAKAIRVKLERDFGREWERFIGFLGLLRAIFKSKGIVDSAAGSIYKEIAAIPVPDLVREGKAEEAFSRVAAALDKVLEISDLTRIWDKAWKHSSW
jgi:precorrin-2 dehydrogenase / sirohydrochlorin ferrochelatase